jgi:hypothetical protein
MAIARPAAVVPGSTFEVIVSLPVVGAVDPMPTLPALVMRIRSEAPVVIATVSAAGKKTPVFVSPEVVIEGSAAVPAAKAAVMPVRDVMSLLAPEAAAPIVARTDAPVVAVTIASAKVVMPRFRRAPDAVVEPVPPSDTTIGVVSAVGSEARIILVPSQ